MPNQLNSSSFSSSRQDALLFVIVLIVAFIHFLLLGIGTFWHPTPPTPKPRSKLVVQTIRLNPVQSPAVQNPDPTPALLAFSSTPISSPLPIIEQPKKEPSSISQPVTEEISPQPKKKESPPIPSSNQEVAPIVSSPPSPPLPIKTENKPQPTTPAPKPSFQEAPKKKIKKSAPIKQSIEKTSQKANKKEGEKSKLAAQEAEKKRKQEQAEKKRQQEKERAEAEKKRLQEIAELEKKRQQEITAAQKAAQQKLSKAKETLAKMNETRDKISTSSSSVNLEATSLPKELESLQVDALPIGEIGSTERWSSKEISYSDEVAYRLKMALKLPDYGAVKIELTLDRTGKVIKVKIIQSESNKNKTYVESKISTLLFPSFGQRFEGKSENTFAITLQNESF